jgi:hypothetical protein
MLTLILVAVAVLAGGFGGYKYGASVERKAAAAIAKAATAVGSVATKV